MAKRRKSYRKRRRSTGLAGITSKPSAKTAMDELMDVALIGGGAVAAVKLSGVVDKIVNKDGSKIKGLIAPGGIALVGAAVALMTGGKTDGRDKMKRGINALAKGAAMAGIVKCIEKAINKGTLLSGTDDDQPLMLPGIGSFGMADLPELPHYSENSNADVTTTGNDPQYHMGTPSEVLSGDDDEVVAY